MSITDVAHTADQRWVAKVIWDFWLAVPGCNELDAAAWVADCEREVSLKPLLVGDHGMAKGIAQHWPARRAFIKEHTGIDMATASVADQCKGILFEVSDRSSPYRYVLPSLIAAKDDKMKNGIIIGRFEQSANQIKDLARQLPMARFWLKEFGANGS